SCWRTASEGDPYKGKTMPRELPADGGGLVERGDGSLPATAAMEIVHGDVDVNLATRRLDAQDHGFGIGVAGKPLFAHVNFRRKDLEAKALIIEKRDRIADDHIGELTHGLANNLLALRNRRAGEMSRNADGHFRGKIKDDAAFDIALNQNERGDAL